MNARTWFLIGAGLVACVLLFGGGTAIVKAVKKARSRREETNLAGLQPSARRALEQLIARLEARGVKVLVGSTLRDADEQAAILARGSSATSQSWHLLGRAVDLYPIGPDGVADLAGKHVELFRTMHAEAAALGWRGIAFNPDGSKRFITTNKGKVWDGGHLELRDGMTWAAAFDALKTRVT